MENREADILVDGKPISEFAFAYLPEDKKAIYLKAKKLVARDRIRKKIFNFAIGLICGVTFLVIDFCLAIIPMAIIKPTTILGMGVSFFSFFIIFMGLIVLTVVILARNAGRIMKETEEEKTGLI